MKRLFSALLTLALLFTFPTAAFAQGNGITSAEELERYLNATYGSVDTPMGVEELTFSVSQNDSNRMPYDYDIEADWFGVEPYKIEDSISYSDAEKQETIEILADVQRNVAKIAEQCFPGKKIKGGYYSYYWKYESIHEGFHSTAFLSWANFRSSDTSPEYISYYNETYLDTFHWIPGYDDYDFSSRLRDFQSETSSDKVICDTTAPFSVKQGATYQFQLTAQSRPSFAAGSPSFTVSYAGNFGNRYFFKVHAVGKVGDGCGFYINGAPSPVAVATIS